jgi:hypothetical protein
MVQDCSCCGKVVSAGSGYVCDMGNEKFVISNYPSQGEGCTAFVQTTQKQIKQKVNDPLLNFLNRRKQPKVINPVDETKEKKPTQNSGEEINFKYAFGWIVSAILGGTFIAMLLMGII